MICRQFILHSKKCMHSYLSKILNVGLSLVTVSFTERALWIIMYSTTGGRGMHINYITSP